jgi:hypothetical protein
MEQASIVEEHIAEIELAATDAETRRYEPQGGRAKWFVDELGQRWVKFVPVGQELEEVWPAERVVRVAIRKQPRP